MAERIEKILLQLDINVDQLKINLQAAKDKLNELKTSQDTAKAALAKLKEENVTAGATFDNLSREVLDYDIAIKQTRDSVTGYARQLKLVEQANASAEGSLNEQKALLSVLTAEYNALSQEERESTDAGKALAAQILSVTNNLKANEQAVGNARRNVGNYESAIKAAFAALNNAKSGVNDTKLAIEQLNQRFRDGAVSQQEYDAELGVLVSELNNSNAEVDNLSQKLDELKGIVTENGEGFKSLRQRLREARDEATLAQDKFSAGLISEKDLVAAQRNVAVLTDEMNDFNRRVDALNPDAKFKAFTQLAQGAAGAVGTVSGAMGLLGAESEDAAQALLKVQQFMQFTQGLNQLGQLADTFDNVRVILGLTTSATNAQTAAQVKGNVANVAGAVTAEGLAVAETQATVATKGLSASLSTLAGPLTIVALVAAGVLASFNAFGETDFAEQTKDIADSVKEENEQHKETIRLLTGINRGRVTNAEAALKEAEANQKLRLSQASTQTEKEEIVTDTRPQIQALEDELLEIKKQAFADELEANRQHLLKLELQRNTAQTESITATNAEAKEKADIALKAAEDEIKTVQQKNSDIRNEQKQLEAELLILPKQRQEQLAAQEKEFDDRRKAALNQASLLRIGLIKDLQTRELAAERESNRQKIEQLLQDEKANAELIIAEKEASAQRIRDINEKFALLELENLNALEIAATVEGTDARIQAEIEGAKRLRDQLIKDETLTATERKRIIAETNAQLNDLEDQRLQLLADRHKAELNLIQQRRDAELQINQARTAPEDLEGNFLLQLQQINASAQTELENRNQIRQDEIRSNESFVKQQIEQRQFSKDFESLTEQEKTEEILRIKDEGRKKEQQINETYNALDKAALLQASREINELTKQAEEQRLSIIVQSKQLQLDAANPEDEYFAKLELLQALNEAEVQSAINSIGTVQQREDAIFAINRKFAKAKEKLDEETFNNALRLTSQTLGQSAGLFKKHTAAYKVLASAQTIIDTYTGATAAFKAMAGIPYVGPILGGVAAAAAIASGLANLAAINNVQFYHGGYTGDGDPKSESTAVGRKWYTYHQQEYVIDHKTLKDPQVSNLVHSVIEPKRLNKFSTESVRQSLPIVRSSFAEGGFTPASILVAPSLSTTTAFDLDAIQTAFENSISKIPRQVLVIEDATQMQQQQILVDQRASY